MPDMYLDVDVALAEVPVNVFPLTDDTDFKTRETAIAYNAAGMDLVWNFVTSAGAMTQTAVTPTTAGDYDWTHQGDGMYSIEIPASGGASINNDTEGYGWFTGFVTGVMPWRGPVIGFRAAAINDSLLDTNTTGLLAPTTAGRTLDVTSGGEAGLDLNNINLPAGAIPSLGIIDNGTAQSATGTTLVLRAAAAFADDEIIGATVQITGGSAGVGQSRIITDYVSSTDTAIVDTWTTTPTGTITYVIYGTPPASDAAAVIPSVDVTQWNGTAVATPTVAGVPEVDITHVSGTAEDLPTATALATVDTNVDAILVDTGTTLPASIATIDTNVDAVLVDTGTTLPATLSTIDTNVDTAISGIITGAAATGTLSTTQASTNLTGYTDDQLIGRVIIWTSGAADGEATDITDYANTNGVLTFTALTTAPGNGDTFKIV